MDTTTPDLKIIRSPAETPEFYQRLLADDFSRCTCGATFLERAEAVAHRRQTNHRFEKAPIWKLKDPQTLLKLRRKP